MRSLNLDILASLERGDGHIYPSAGAPESLAFGEVLGAVDRAASILAEVRLGKGDRIGIHCARGFDWLVWDLACLTLGGVSVPIPAAAAHCPEGFDCRAFVTSDVAVAPPCALHVDAQAYWLKRAVAGRRQVFLPASPATIKFTSGTTSQAKSYVASYGHVEHMVRGIQALFGVQAGDRLLVSMPMNIFLQRILAYTAILASADVAFCDPKAILRAAGRFQPTIIMGPPHLFKSVHDLYRRQQAAGDAAPFARLWGGRARCLWTGSAPVPADLLAFYEAEGLPLYEGYGTTETGMIAKNHPGAYRRGTVGKLFPGVEIHFSSEGEILVRAPYQPAQGTGPGGWHATGDLGHLDEDGYLRLCGRVDDQIVLSNGRKLAPAPLESALRGSSAIGQACVYGDRRPYPIAIVEVSGDAEAMRADVDAAVAALNRELGDQGRLQGFRVVPAGEFARRLCLSEQGKLKRRQVVESFAAEIEALYRQKPSSHAA